MAEEKMKANAEKSKVKGKNEPAEEVLVSIEPYLFVLEWWRLVA